MAAMEKNNKNLNVPNLRFPEFSGEWKETTIGECCSELEYGMNAPSKHFDGVNKYIRITDIDEQTSEYKQDSVVSPDAPLEDKYIVKDRDILFARTGASTGKTYIYNPQDGKMYYAGFLIRANVKMEDNPKFVFYQTQTHRYKKWVSIMSMRSGQPGINSQEYASYKFWKPCKEEQDKISALISLLDTRIQTQKKIIEKYESLIRGLCQKLFCFDEYSTYYLGNICSITTGKLDANAMVMDGKYPFFTCAEEVFNIDNYAFDTEALLISGNGANLGYIHYFNGKFNAYQRTYVLDKFTIDINYIRLYLETFLKNRIEQEKNIGNTPYIVLGTLSKMKIRVPNIITQQKIVKTLSSLKEKLSNERLALVKYGEQKKYLLSNLFI